MNSFEQSAAAVIDQRLNLVAQLSELERLREQVWKAEQSAQNVRQSKQRKRTPIERSAHP
jgi:hypothetical protein